ncbi:MAG: peptidoglycan DD-metalloendopeptidase family protein [Thermodesulfovibrionales bacterium]
MKTTPDIASSANRSLESLRGRKDPEAIKAVAREMETLFAHELIKAMRQTVKPASEESGFGRDTYMSMFDMELARILSDRGLGLQDLMVNGMSRQVQNAPGGVPEQKGTADTDFRTVPEGPTVKPAVPHAVTPAAPATKKETGLPVNGVISSKYGMRKHPVYGDHRFHRGVDIAAPLGSEIRPIGSGTVTFSGEKSGYGNIVIVDHGNGMTSRYAHNKVNMVKAGDVVDESTVIGEVGNEGVSTGPHLHLEVKQNGRNINPLTVLAMR